MCVKGSKPGVKVEAIGCKKMFRLARTLQIPQAHAVGLMEMFWAGVAKDATDGSLRDIDAIEVSIWCGWDGDPQALLCALASARWIDRCERHRWLVHDWAQHCQDSVHRRLIRERRWFADGTVPKFRQQDFHSDERQEIEKFYRENTPPACVPVSVGGEAAGGLSVGPLAGKDAPPWSETGGLQNGHGPPWRNAESPWNFRTPYRTEPNHTQPNPTEPSSEGVPDHSGTAGRGGGEGRRRPKKAGTGQPGAAMAGELAAGLWDSYPPETWLSSALHRHSRFTDPPDRDLVRGLLQDAAGQDADWWAELLSKLEAAGQRPGKAYGWYIGIVQREMRAERGAA